ncbi:MAG TPA: NUDIX hydrolase N-terminal domain-containing protein [Actinopolymorphaceae bacterium]|jgi:ADP-ribose pyrophosphatase YjhB (NUDIX family)
MTPDARTQTSLEGTAELPAEPAPATPDSSDESRPPSPGQRLHSLAVELAALSRNGLTYETDRYAIARYNRIQAISAEIMGMLSGSDPAEFRAALAAEAGHATPKVDVRGALIRDDRILLVQEARDGRWTLPGGWADALDTPSEAVEREFAEEAGLTVRATKLAAVYDGSRSNGHAESPWHIYKLFFLVQPCDDAEPRAGLDGETTDVGFFALDDLPELSTARVTVDQLATLIAHGRDPGRPTHFD